MNICTSLFVQRKQPSTSTSVSEKIFERHNIPLPDSMTETQWYRVYRNFEKNNDLRLSKAEATKFALFLHEQIAAKHADWEHLGAHAPLLVKNEHGNYSPVREEDLEKQNAEKNGKEKTNGVAAVPEVPEETTTKAVFHAASDDWRTFAEPHHVDLAKEKVENWHGTALQSTIHDIFKEVDADTDGHLEWNNSEIRMFVRNVFKHLNLPLPQIPEMVWYRMYREVDVNSDYSLTEAEAAVLVKHILTRICHLHE
jgi:hypothetical protein